MISIAIKVMGGNDIDCHQGSGRGSQRGWNKVEMRFAIIPQLEFLLALGSGVDSTPLQGWPKNAIQGVTVTLPGEMKSLHLREINWMNMAEGNSDKAKLAAMLGGDFKVDMLALAKYPTLVVERSCHCPAVGKSECGSSSWHL